MKDIKGEGVFQNTPFYFIDNLSFRARRPLPQGI
jgi:hypothetical protein